MSEKERRERLARVAEVLGLELGETSLSVEAVRKCTKRKLLEATRLLGIRGVSSLNKEPLVQRLSSELELRGAAPREETAGTGKATAGKEIPRKETPAEKEPAARRPALPGRRRAVVSPAVTKVAAAGGVAPGGATPEEGAAPAPREEPEAPQIPWGYAHNRVVALPVDPDRLFVYWEVTDEGIEHARQRLGAAEESWLGMRVYDTTGRLFDGTNAHASFDQPVQRNDRQWFFDLSRPGSEAFVEIGLLSTSGRFEKIVRSHRVDFPRRNPSTPGEPQWLTVTVQRSGSDPRPIWHLTAGAATGRTDAPAAAARGEETESARAWTPGTSEAAPSGASEHRLGGASEQRFEGASEHRFEGSSEHSFTGSSEKHRGR